MTKAMEVKRGRTSQNNIVNFAIERREKKLGRKIRRPAGKNDKLHFGAMEIGSEKGLEIIYGTDFERNNERLLESGFSKGTDEILSLKAFDNTPEIAQERAKINKEKGNNIVSLEEEKEKREKQPEENYIGA